VVVGRPENGIMHKAIYIYVHVDGVRRCLWIEASNCPSVRLTDAEPRGREVNTPSSCSEGPGFKSRPLGRL
jgi:hypothetical protein